MAFQAVHWRIALPASKYRLSLVWPPGSLRLCQRLVLMHTMGVGGPLPPLLLDDSLEESLLESDVPSELSVSLEVAPSLEVSSVDDVSVLVVPSVSLAALLSAGGTLSGTLSWSPCVRGRSGNVKSGSRGSISGLRWTACLAGISCTWSSVRNLTFLPAIGTEAVYVVSVRAGPERTEFWAWSCSLPVSATCSPSERTEFWLLLDAFFWKKRMVHLRYVWA